MHASSGIIALAAFLCSAQAATFGFNYGAQFTDDSAKQESDFAAEFSAAKKLAGTNGKFTSARLYTMIQHGTTNEVIQAIPAAIESSTHLLLGLWASGDAANFQNEVNTLKKAIQQYPEIADLVDGISVGSEDLYRISDIGLNAPDAAPGNGPEVISKYIQQVRDAIKGTSLSASPVGHVDTWTAWANSSNSAVAKNSDFIGTDAYPYFQDTMDNSIDDAEGLLEDALAETRKYTGDTPIWITETGWPVSGPDSNLASANTDDAKTFWDKVACKYLESDDVNVWWYTLLDAQPTTPSPSFGLIGDVNGKPKYDLSCKDSDKSSSSSKSSSHSKTGSAGSTKTGSAGSSSTSVGDLDSPGLSKSNAADSSATKANGGSYPVAGGSGFATGSAPMATGTAGAGSGSGAGNSTGTYAAPNAPAPTGTGANGGAAGAPGASETGIATGGAAATGFSIAAVAAAAVAALL